MTLSLKINKFGYLNGLLRFETTTGKYFEEPVLGQTVMQFVVLRTLGTYGDIEVIYSRNFLINLLMITL